MTGSVIIGTTHGDWLERAVKNLFLRCVTMHLVCMSSGRVALTCHFQRLVHRDEKMKGNNRPVLLILEISNPKKYKSWLRVRTDDPPGHWLTVLQACYFQRQRQTLPLVPVLYTQHSLE